MADKKSAAGASDTDFRKQYDRAAYAEKARENDKKRREEGEARAAAAAAGKKWHARAKTPDDVKDTTARSGRINFEGMVGRTTLVPAGASLGKRGRGAGLYCEACDLTFSDNLQWVDHLNDPRHLSAIGESGQIKRSTLDEVRERLRYLSRVRREAQQDVVVDLDARLELSRENEEKEREEKRRKRNEKRRKTPGGRGHVEIKMENDGIIN
ncbi:hypothetical protein K504DRAFT_472202 [Pleomassaria siparia CBS 279.74]|uniref:C2H2-type domain-containing protein n=1 Tax=Pleomassaria siparia CBS 279.74 TaxID=1314801 RepID=A0A6G1JVV2_9PLEO|nr:hypothetical protein K504DRAFT_472202 [Pleomassaria siparia CBS 279.74]